MKNRDTQDRREFLQSSALGLFSFSISGIIVQMTPAQAKDRNIPFAILNADEVRTLEALGETLHPGAAEAGLAHFVDYQISLDPDECMSLVKYFVEEPPFDAFYRAGLKSLDAYCAANFKQPFAGLDQKIRNQVVGEIWRGKTPGWNGPVPAPLFYMVTRNDTVDVLYGTLEGFRRLGVPYMPHILPPKGW